MRTPNTATSCSPFTAPALRDQRALSFVNLYDYGGGFDMLAALAAKVSPFTLFETRRLVGALVGIIGMIAVWRTARRVGGPLAGLIALALIATCPLYRRPHVHQCQGRTVRGRDGDPAARPGARASIRLPAPAPAPVLSSGSGFGLSIGSRIMGGFGVIEHARCARAAVRDRYARQDGATSRRAARTICPGAASRHCRARLCGHGADLALGRRRSAQSAARDRLLLALLRKALERVVRRQH